MTTPGTPVPAYGLDRGRRITRRMLPGFAEVKSALRHQTERLCRELFPNGIVVGHEFQVGNIEGDPGDSMSVNISSGHKSGVWSDFEYGSVGDVIDLIAQKMYCGDRFRAMKWLAQWLGLDHGDHEQISRMVSERKSSPITSYEQEEDGARAAAKKVWLAAQASLLDTPVDYYLRGRCIPLSFLYGAGEAAGSSLGVLRFHPALWCSETEGKTPAMVAGIIGVVGTAADGRPKLGQIAVHRTYLERKADGSWGKAALKRSKMALGSFKGGFIPLWRGKSGKSLKDAPEGERPVIAEGLEDGLTVALKRPDMRVLVAVSGSNLGNIWLPPQIKSVTIAKQNDTKPEAIKSYHRRVQMLRDRGIEVFSFRPPDGIKDVNDWHCLKERELKVEEGRS
ncbi:DNA primase [Azospirillaceae bacterium]